MATVTVRRDQLYKQLWSMPGQRLAALYGVSDVGLAKACKRYDIPRPPRGYWARIAVGQKVRRPALPKSLPADEPVYFTGWTMTDETFDAAASDKSPKAKSLSDTDPAIAALQAELLAAKPQLDGLISASAMDVAVSPKQIERCISLLDQLVRRWSERGGNCETVVREGRPASYLSIGSDRFAFRMEEAIDEARPVTDPGRLTERLVIHISGHERQQFRRRWADTKTQRLERMLGLLVETIVSAITAEKQIRLDEECVERQKQKVAAIRRKSNSDDSREFYLRQHLMQDVSRWHDAQRIRAYLEAVEALVREGRRQIDPDRYKEWMSWAKQFADSIDPLVNTPLPEGAEATQTNVPAADLDLTSATKAVVTALAVPDTDTLSRMRQDRLREHCPRGYGKVWNEITRTLEGLGYDVSKRENVSEWW